MTAETLTGRQIAETAPDGWANLLGGLQTRIHTADFGTGLAFVNAVGAAAERIGHHPDLDLRYSHVDIRLTSHDAGGITDRDIQLAQAISELAKEAGLATHCDSVSRIELALDSPALQSVRPFWGAALAMDALPPPAPHDELRDRFGTTPVIWFQDSGSDEPRQRWHLDVWVSPDQVESRMQAAVDAGGTVVSDAEAPAFWVLADPEGNRMCLCTWQDRD